MSKFYEHKKATILERMQVNIIRRCAEM